MRLKFIFSSNFFVGLMFSSIVLFGIVCCFILPGIIRETFQSDSDWYWCDDNISWFVNKNHRLPTNWEELFEFNSSQKYYSPIPGIEQRMEINFVLFDLIKQGYDGSTDSSSSWAYRFNSNLKGKDMQKYIDMLDKNDE